MATKTKLTTSFAAHERFFAAVQRAQRATKAPATYAVCVEASAGTAPASAKVLAEIAKRFGRPVPADLAQFWSRRWRGFYEYREGDFVGGVTFMAANKALHWYKNFATWRAYTKVPERLRLLAAGLPLATIRTGRSRTYIVLDGDPGSRGGVRLYPETTPKLSALPAAPITTTFAEFFEHALAAGYFFGTSRRDFARYWAAIEPLLQPTIAPRHNLWLRFIQRAFRTKLV